MRLPMQHVNASWQINRVVYHKCKSSQFVRAQGHEFEKAGEHEFAQNISLDMKREFPGVCVCVYVCVCV